MRSQSGQTAWRLREKGCGEGLHTFVLVFVDERLLCTDTAMNKKVIRSILTLLHALHRGGVECQDACVAWSHWLSFEQASCLGLTC